MSAWQVVNASVSLGRLLPHRPAVDAELVVEDRVAVPVNCNPLEGIGSIRLRDSSRAAFRLLAPSLPPQSYRIVIADAILTPKADLDIECAPLGLAAGSVHRLWHASSPQRGFSRTELQSPSSARRIWTWELLPLRACRLDRQTWFETQTITAHHQERPDLDLIPADDLQPALADLKRAPVPLLKSASASSARTIPRIPGHLPQKTRLMGPQIKLTFDLQPLKRECRKVTT